MIKRWFLALACVCAGTLSANSHPMPGGWGFTAEYLYFMPNLDDTYFVTQSDVTTTFPNGNRLNNDFNYHSGFRLGAAYGFCDGGSDWTTTYTWLRPQQQKQISGDFLWATIGRADFASSFENYAGTANSDLSLFYDRVDSVIGLDLYSMCGANLRMQFGLEYALLRLHEDYTFAITGGALGTISQKSRTWGVGPQLGVGLDYDLFRSDDLGGLSFTFLSSGSLLAGETGTRETNVLTGTTLLDVSDRKARRIIPAFHTRVGLNYCTSFGNMDANIEVGYELNSYYRGLTRVLYQDDVGDGLATNNYTNFDVQGLYVSASINF